MTSLAVRDDPVPAVPPRADAGAALAAVLDELETLSRFDAGSAADRAEAALATARELGRADLEQRARLVCADLLRRRGAVSDAGRTAQEVHRWATDTAHRHLLARSSFVLTAVFQELGDLAGALEHAVVSVDLLDDDDLPALRVDHLVRMADVLGLSRDPAAPERYAAVLRLAEDLGDVDRQLRILNNRAYTDTLSGRFESALEHSDRLQALAAEHDVPLDVGRLDTVARALMGLGRLDEAEAALLPGLRALDASHDGDAGADFLLTLAEVQRLRGEVDAAGRTLAECLRRCAEHGLASIRVRARAEQAELHAAAGDHRAAFEEHKRYVAELVEQQSAQREARARTLQAMYETTEARRQSRRWRELSLRDPLTGLYNRRHVDEELPRLLAAPATADELVVVALLDLDHFKRVNDTCSHAVGDEVLRTVAGLLQDTALPGATSFAARLGGEEFVLVLAGTDADRAAAHLEDVRRAVAAHPWAPLTGELPVTISVGAASTAEVIDRTPAQLLGLADARLYRAKRAGRDRVVTAG
ncbi:diguanylate cyclase [Geodermatophilus sp. FMUSA9-8]|uniref:diguanylate cyclase n=1 Tax=Geodermatophilus sp. FMUSA9-8 TaxID=3120155 RepID=UPI0030093D79